MRIVDVREEEDKLTKKKNEVLLKVVQQTETN